MTSPEATVIGPSQRSSISAGTVIVVVAPPAAVRLRRFWPGLPNGAVGTVALKRLPEPKE